MPALAAMYALDSLTLQAVTGGKVPLADDKVLGAGVWLRWLRGLLDELTAPLDEPAFLSPAGAPWLLVPTSIFTRLTGVWSGAICSRSRSPNRRRRGWPGVQTSETSPGGLEAG